jgi:ATP-dependent exoDNAse (exonuclease V) alpha subunit
VLTGGPGCGKSFTVRSVVELARANQAGVVLVAPTTGRAAKRLAELTGHEASTVHRLLELQPGGEPKYDRDHPLDADLVVVDECSMMDVILANKLVKAIPEGAHLLLVGDVDQLPSVGAGEVLRDLLATERIPRVRLTQIFRQARQSGIVVNAHRINHGQPPQLTGFPDFYWFTCDPAEDSGLHPAEETAKLLVDIVARRLPAKFGVNPIRDVQVLTPMHRGPAGAGNLNALLQDALSPERDGTLEKRYGDRVFRVGDKVTQLPNNYNKGKAGIFNGTVGVVTALSLQEQTVNRAHRRGRAHRLRVRRTRRARPRLRDHHPPLPRQRIPRRGHPAHHLLLDDAPAQPALHRHHPRQATHRPGRIPPRTRPSRPHPRRRPPLHRTHPSTPTNRERAPQRSMIDRTVPAGDQLGLAPPNHAEDPASTRPRRSATCRQRVSARNIAALG